MSLRRLWCDGICWQIMYNTIWQWNWTLRWMTGPHIWQKVASHETCHQVTLWRRFQLSDRLTWQNLAHHCDSMSLWEQRRGLPRFSVLDQRAFTKRSTRTKALLLNKCGRVSGRFCGIIWHVFEIFSRKYVSLFIFSLPAQSFHTDLLFCPAKVWTKDPKRPSKVSITKFLPCTLARHFFVWNPFHLRSFETWLNHDKPLLLARVSNGTVTVTLKLMSQARTRLSEVSSMEAWDRFCQETDCFCFLGWNYVEASLIRFHMFNHFYIYCSLLFSLLLLVVCLVRFGFGGGRGKAQTQLAEKTSLDFFGAGVVRSSPCVWLFGKFLYKMTCYDTITAWQGSNMQHWRLVKCVQAFHVLHVCSSWDFRTFKRLEGLPEKFGWTGKSPPEWVRDLGRNARKWRKSYVQCLNVLNNTC